MKYLKDISFKDISQVLWFDIETVSQHKTIDTEHPQWDAWRQKVDWDDKVSTDEHIKDKYVERAAIYKEFGKIVSVSYGRVADGLLKLKNIASENEDKLLEEFVKNVNSFFASGKVKFLGGFSISQFDIPFVDFRCLVNGVSRSPYFDTAGLPPWKLPPSVDLQTLLKGSSSTGISLEALSIALDVDNPKILNTSCLNKDYHEGNLSLQNISKYNNEDVRATVQCFNRYLEQPLVNTEQVKEVVRDVKSSTLQKLYKDNDLTDEIKEEIRESCNTKLTEKEKKHLKEILLGVYLRTDFVSGDQDNKATKESKSKEVNDFVESLSKPKKIKF